MTYCDITMMYNNYSMSPSWIWSDKITNEHVARVGYNHFISNNGEWNNWFSKFSIRFISTILQSVRKENLAHYFPYDVKLRLLVHSRRFLANQKARNAIVGAENLLNWDIRSTRLQFESLGKFDYIFLISQKLTDSSLLSYVSFNSGLSLFQDGESWRAWDDCDIPQSNAAKGHSYRR